MGQAVFVSRRRGTGAGAWHAAKALGLAFAGFAYLIALIALVSAAADWMGAL